MEHGVYFTKKELFLIWNLLLDCHDNQKIIFCYGNCDMGSKDKIKNMNQNELIQLIDKVSTSIDLKGVK